MFSQTFFDQKNQKFSIRFFSDRLQVRLPYEDDEEYIDLGAAELSFYAILVELLGRCAPSEETIKMGKPNATRAKSILKSLVSMHDLEGVLGLKFLLPRKSNEGFEMKNQTNVVCFFVRQDENTMPPGLQPSHKMSIILFLERVYGIPDQETFFRLIEDAFLPDIRAATILDMVKSFSLAKNVFFEFVFVFRQRSPTVTWLWR